MNAVRALTLHASDVVKAVGGRLVSGEASATVPSFSIDSRTVAPGDLYVAIRGERLDGHAFVEQALRAGACGAMVSEPMAGLPRDAADGRLLIVAPDTTRALQGLARWIRQRSGASVVGITGSAGKTTTKEIAAAFVGLRHDVMRSSGNFNNHIGLPLSLLELRHGADVAVVELGMNHAGEIRRLVAIAEPDVRVWTNVAEVHVEFFPSIEGVADAKAEILEGATAKTVLVANADDPRVVSRIGGFPGRTVSFGTAEGAAVRAVAIEDAGIDGTRADVTTPLGTLRLESPLLGRGNLFNALAGVAVGLEFGIPLEAMADRARTLTSAPHRGDILKFGDGLVVVDDAYNANPRAVEAALAVVAREARYTRRIAVLGEMLELGEQSLALHQQVGRVAADSDLAALVTVGGASARGIGEAAVASGMPASAVHHVDTSDEAAAYVSGLVRGGDLVLVKGSRGIRTERVVERLAAERV